MAAINDNPSRLSDSDKDQGDGERQPLIPRRDRRDEGSILQAPPPPKEEEEGEKTKSPTTAIFVPPQDSKNDKNAKNEDKDDKKGDDDDEEDGEEDKKSDKPHVLTEGERILRRKYRSLAFASAAVAIIFYVAIVASKQQAIVAHEGYDVAQNVMDVLVIDLIRCVALVLSVTVDSPRPIHYCFHSAVFTLILLSTKLWTFRGWTGSDRAGDSAPWTAPTVVVLAIIGTIFHIVITTMIDRLDNPPKAIINFRAVIRVLRPYFLPTGVCNKIVVATTWMIVALSKACNLLAPLFLATAVTKMTSEPPESPYLDLSLFGLFGLLPKAFEEIQDILSTKVWQIAFVEVADISFKHVHSLSLDWHLRKKMGNVLRSINRGQDAAETLMGYVVMWLLPNIGMAIASFVIFLAHFHQPNIAAACWGFLGVYCWITYVMTMWRKKYREQMNVHDNDMHDKATDALVNFETVKYFANEEYEANRYTTAVRAYQRMHYISQFSLSALNVAQTGIIQTCTVVALCLAAYAVMNKENGFNIGEFVALQAYLINIFSPLSFLGTLYSMMITNIINLQNLCDLLAEKPDLVDKPNAKELIIPKDCQCKGIGIEFRNIRFKYPAQTDDQGLHDVSFTVPPGTTTAIVGSTGSGKTTLSRLLFRFYDAASGSVLVNNQDVQAVTQKSLRKAIGIVPQDTVLFNESVKHNIAYAKIDATQEELDKAARQARIADFIQQQDEKWETVVGERGLKLSGGEKQRVAIARCLLKDPPIVVLDEATSALDNKTEKEVQEALAALEGRTTIVIAHRLTTVQNADQIIVMKKGRVLERGTHNDLLAAEGEYFEMWNAQAKASAEKAIKEGEKEKEAAEGESRKKEEPKKE